MPQHDDTEGAKILQFPDILRRPPVLGRPVAPIPINKAEPPVEGYYSLQHPSLTDMLAPTNSPALPDFEEMKRRVDAESAAIEAAMKDMGIEVHRTEVRGDDDILAGYRLTPMGEEALLNIRVTWRDRLSWWWMREGPSIQFRIAVMVFCFVWGIMAPIVFDGPNPFDWGLASRMWFGSSLGAGILYILVQDR